MKYGNLTWNTLSRYQKCGFDFAEITSEFTMINTAQFFIVSTFYDNSIFYMIYENVMYDFPGFLPQILKLPPAPGISLPRTSVARLENSKYTELHALPVVWILKTSKSTRIRVPGGDSICQTHWV